MKDIVLVTCKRWPALSASDSALARELSDLGHRVRSSPWNGAPTSEFTSADMVVLRSNWDFHHDLAAFDDWLGHIETSGAELHNPAGLIRSHLDKTYLEHLAAAGWRTPRTLMTSDFEMDTVLEWVDEHGFDRVVVKPVWGASGHGVNLVRRADLAATGRDWMVNPDRRPMLVQEFVPEVGSGECALVFFRGEFSHALLRRPAVGDFRVNSQYGGSVSLLDDVDATMVELGGKIEATLPEVATYVRIDLVATGSGHVVMEIEVNEPALGLDLAPGSAARFAAALVGERGEACRR
jgi:glutathione synthase/RimK-type ligase-like ATP-grasp enzyme